MPFDIEPYDWWGKFGGGRDKIEHRYVPVPFISIQQWKLKVSRVHRNRDEPWTFTIRWPNGIDYESPGHMRFDRTDAEMVADMGREAEKYLLWERSCLILYCKTGQHRRDIDAMLRRHGHSPVWCRLKYRLADLFNRRN